MNKDPKTFEEFLNTLPPELLVPTNLMTLLQMAFISGKIAGMQEDNKNPA